MLPITRPSKNYTFLLEKELEHMLKVLAPFYHSEVGDYNKWAHGGKKNLDRLTKEKAGELLKKLYNQLENELEAIRER